MHWTTDLSPTTLQGDAPFFQSLYGVCRNGCTLEGMPLASGMIATQQKMIELCNDEIDRLPFDDRATSMKRLNEEISIFSHVASCFFTGRNIFHLQLVSTALGRARVKKCRRICARILEESKPVVLDYLKGGQFG